MRKTEIREVKRCVETDIICDRCGKSCKGKYDTEGLFASTIGGYESWYDGQQICIDLCQHCLKELCEWVWGPDTTKWRCE